MPEENPRQDRSSTAGRRVAAILLSLLLIPGAGHILLGMHRRGAAWFAAMALAISASSLSIWFLLAGVFVTRLAATIDLWLCSRHTASSPTLRESVAPLVVIVILFVLVTAAVRSYSGEAFKIPSSSMEPTLHWGDHIMVRKYDRVPTRGDVVVFSYPCDRRMDYVKRVVAVEGDTVELRCDTLYVNGMAVPRQAIVGACSYTDNMDGAWVEESCSSYRETLDGRSYTLIQGAHEQPMEPGLADFPGDQVPSCQDWAYGPRPVEQTLGTIVESSPSAQLCAPQRAYQVPSGHFFAMGDNRENSSDSRVWGAVPNTSIRGKAVYIWWSSQPGQGTRWGDIGRAL